jgi:serine/threonine-protein kinase
LIYVSISSNNNAALVSAPADGSSPPPAYQVGEAPLRRFAGTVSPDGKLVMGRNVTQGVSGNDFWILPLLQTSSASTKPASFLDARFTKNNPQFSPDGRWLAYDSTDTGASQIYVVPYPGPGGKWPVSTDGGNLPRWAAKNHELFYINGRKMMAVEVQTTPAFRAGVPKMLFERNFPATGAPASYDVTADGKRFLMLKEQAERQGAPDQLHVVVNWFEELRRRVPLEGK